MAKNISVFHQKLIKPILTPRYIVVLVTLWISAGSLKSQPFNYLQDPSFEDIKCNNYGEHSLIVGFRPTWRGLLDLYDLFGICEGHRQRTDPHPRIPTPRDGKYFASHYVSSLEMDPAHPLRFVFENKLREPLESGKYYYFKIHNMLAPWSVITVDNFAFIAITSATERNKITPFTGLDAHTMLYRHPEGQFLSTTSIEWERLEGCFQARGGEDLLIFVLDITNTLSNNPNQRPNPDVDLRAGGSEPHRYYNPPEGFVGFFWDDAAIVEIPEELTYEVTFCDNDDIRLLDSAQIKWPDVVTMKGATHSWDDGVRTLERSMVGRKEYHLTVTLPCTEVKVGIQVNERACQEFIYIPNAFTPNGDGINDIFRPEGILFDVISLDIYDRYGSVVHQSKGQDAYWDGTSRVKTVQTGVYVYQIIYRTEYGTEENVSGEIFLYR